MFLVESLSKIYVTIIHTPKICDVQAHCGYFVNSPTNTYPPFNVFPYRGENEYVFKLNLFKKYFLLQQIQNTNSSKK